MAIVFEGTPPPIPPVELIHRVVPPFGAETADGQRLAFDSGGQYSIRCLERGLASAGSEWRQFERILDFGCGPARMLRWMGPLADSAELHGLDVDADAIAWAAANVPFATFAVGPHEPPTGFPDHYFDLVINHSVFTHLDERMQDLWLAELRRVTRPGGLLLLTVHSATQVRDFYAGLAGVGVEPEPFRAELEESGILFVRDDHYIGSAHPDFYHSTLHTPWYVLEHWHQYFEIRAYLPHGADTQDLVVVERRADDALVAQPIGHGRSDRTRSGTVPFVRTLARRALARLARRLGADGDDGTAARRLGVLEHALEQQGERITLLQRDLRREIDELRG